MAILDFSWHGYRFQNGLGVLRSSLTTAREAVNGAAERARDEAIGYQDRVAQGLEEAQIEYDDNGYVILDEQDILNWNVQVAEDAATALRKAFVIAAYHHWERSARDWAESVHGKHPKLVELTLAKGYPVSPRLDAIRDLVNLLKHANAKWGGELAKSWPEMLHSGLQPTPMLDWYEAVNLTDELVDEVFEAISQSGPDSTLTTK